MTNNLEKYNTATLQQVINAIVSAATPEKIFLYAACHRKVYSESIFLQTSLLHQTVPCYDLLVFLFDGTIISNQEQSYLAVYGKFMRFIFWEVIRTKSELYSLECLIHAAGGTIGVPQKIQDIYLPDFN